MSDTSQPASEEPSEEPESHEMPPAGDVLGTFVHELNKNLQRYASQ